MQVVGPVIVTVAHSFDADGNDRRGLPILPGSPLNLFSESVMLESGAVLYGRVCAPRGAVTVSHNAVLVGAVVSDRLAIARGGRVAVDCGPTSRRR